MAPHTGHQGVLIFGRTLFSYISEQNSKVIKLEMQYLCHQLIKKEIVLKMRLSSVETTFRVSRTAFTPKSLCRFRFPNQILNLPEKKID